MVKLRLKRSGSKFNAFYRIVAADSRAPRDGKYIEEIGFYNPHTKEIRIDLELKDKWLKEGAVPSETVKSLFKKALSNKIESNSVKALPKKEKKVKKVTSPQVEEASSEKEVVEENKQQSTEDAKEVASKADSTQEESK